MVKKLTQTVKKPETFQTEMLVMIVCVLVCTLPEGTLVLIVLTVFPFLLNSGI